MFKNKTDRHWFLKLNKISRFVCFTLRSERDLVIFFNIPKVFWSIYKKSNLWILLLFHHIFTRSVLPTWKEILHFNLTHNKTTWYLNHLIRGLNYIASRVKNSLQLIREGWRATLHKRSRNAIEPPRRCVRFPYSGAFVRLSN